MKISVIVPTFNRARYIGEAIRSVLSQTVQPLEIIVIDDGSTDTTSEVVGALQEANPRICIRYIYQPNAGASAARNTGIKAATGDFIAFLDSDDKWPVDWIAQQVALHEAHPELDVSFGREAKFSDGGQLEPVDDGYEVPTGRLWHPFDFLVGGINVPTSSVMVRRSCFAEVGGFDPAYVPCEDKDLWLRLAMHGKRFGFINAVLSHRRMHEGNLVNNRLRVKEAATRVLERHIERAENLYGDHYVMRERLSELHYDLGSAYLKLMAWERADHHLRRVYPIGAKQRVLLAFKRAVVGVAA